MNRASAVGVCIAVGLLVSPAVEAQLQTVVLLGGTLVDGTGRAPIHDPVVVVEGPRIKAVGVRGRLTYPGNARVINTEGLTILPGLIDSHVHLRDYMPPLFLRYGITTVGDTNNFTDWILWQRTAHRSGQIKGPRLYVSGTAAAGPEAEESGISHRLTTTDEARAYARELIGRGVDMLKVDLNLTLEQLSAITDEAARAGVPVVGHSQNIRKAIEIGGLKYLEHTDTLGRAILEEMGPETLKQGGATPERLMDTNRFEPLIQLMVREGVFVNATAFVRWRSSTPHAREWADAAREAVKDPALAFVPEDVRVSWTQLPARAPDPEGFRRTSEFIRRFAAAGGRVIAGSDAGVLPGISLHYEMQMLTDMGVTPMAAIQAATLWAAQSIGQGKELGSVEPGKLADFTVIEGDPLKDITATTNLRMVIKEGQLLDTSYDPRFVNPSARPR